MSKNIKSTSSLLTKFALKRLANKEPAFAVTITPKQAEEMLKYNTRNRKSSKTRAEKYAKHIQYGTFECDGNAIKFAEDENGNTVLVDGQTRLEAIVKAGKPAQVYVVGGLAPGAVFTQDDNRVRTNADRGKIDGWENPYEEAGAANYHRCLSKAGTFYSDIRWRKQDWLDCKAYRGKHVRSITAGVAAYKALSPSFRQMVKPKAAWIALYAMFHAKDPAAASDMFAMMDLSYTGGVPGPVAHLRNEITKYNVNKHDPNAGILLMCKAILAWNAICEGRSPRSLKFTVEDLMPETGKGIPAVLSPKKKRK